MVSRREDACHRWCWQEGEALEYLKRWLNETKSYYYRKHFRLQFKYSSRISWYIYEWLIKINDSSNGLWYGNITRKHRDIPMCIIYLPVLPLFKFVTSSNRSRKLLHHSRFSHTGLTGVYSFNVIREFKD